MSNPSSLERIIVVKLSHGLHIRVCSQVVSLVSKCGGKVSLHNGDKVADASSMFDLMQLAALPGTALRVEATCENPDEVIDSLERLLTNEQDPVD